MSLARTFLHNDPYEGARDEYYARDYQKIKVSEPNQKSVIVLQGGYGKIGPVRIEDNERERE